VQQCVWRSAAAQRRGRAAHRVRAHRTIDTTKKPALGPPRTNNRKLTPWTGGAAAICLAAAWPADRVQAQREMSAWYNIGPST
jgi:hypothetical protein